LAVNAVLTLIRTAPLSLFATLTGSVSPATQFHRVLDPAPLVQHVEEAEPGVSPDHSGSGVAHHYPRLLALHSLVAVDRTLGTGGFLLAVGALQQTLLRVLQQRMAITARRRPIAAMMIPAVDADHLLQRSILAGQARLQSLHGAEDNPLPGPQTLITVNSAAG